MAKKNKQVNPEITETIQAKEAIVFNFTDKDIVEVIGTDDKHKLSSKKTYKVSGSVAKVLINKGAAVLKTK